MKYNSKKEYYLVFSILLCLFAINYCICTNEMFHLTFNGGFPGLPYSSTVIEQYPILPYRMYLYDI